jgi:hypothetical protein
MDDTERLRTFVNGRAVARDCLTDLMLFLLIIMSALFSLFWMIVFPVVGMLYMLGYLT